MLNLVRSAKWNPIEIGATHQFLLDSFLQSFGFWRVAPKSKRLKINLLFQQPHHFY